MRRLTIPIVIALCALGGAVPGHAETPTAGFVTMRVRGTPGRSVALRSGGLTSAVAHLDGSWQRIGLRAKGSVRLAKVGDWLPGDRMDAQVVSTTSGTPSTTAVTAGTRVVTMNGSPFVAKGYLYWPAPIGTQWPASNWADPDACQRDARLLGGGGVTLLRVPYEDSAPQYTTEYNACLDSFWANGIAVAWLVEPPGGEHIQNDPAWLATYQTKLTGAVSAVGGHPATAFWIIGNEIERSNDGTLWLGNKTNGTPAMLNGLIQTVKQADASRHLAGTTICCPITSWLTNANVPLLDIWGINAYSQPHDSPGTFYPGLSSADPRPKLITETGIDRLRCIRGAIAVDNNGTSIVNSCKTYFQNYAASSREDQVSQRDWNSSIWTSMSPHVSTTANPSGDVFGVTYFMWSDLWWFSLGALQPMSPAHHDVVGMGPWPAPDGLINVEWHGVSHAQLATATEQRVTSLAFDALAQAWSTTAPPTMSSFSASLSPLCALTVSWTTSAPATTEVQAGAQGEDGNEGGDLRTDDTIFQQVYYNAALTTTHSVTLSGVYAMYKVVGRSFTAGGQSVTSAPVRLWTC